MSIDPDFKRRQFLALKEAADNGQLIPPPRKKFSKAVRTAVLERQEGLCAACEERIFGRFDIDHILERDLGGSDDLPNLVALHPECHRPKTSARAPVLAKVHRLARTTFEGKSESKRPIPQRENPWPEGRPFPKSNRKIPSRGFSKWRPA